MKYLSDYLTYKNVLNENKSDVNDSENSLSKIDKYLHTEFKDCKLKTYRASSDITDTRIVIYIEKLNFNPYTKNKLNDYYLKFKDKLKNIIEKKFKLNFIDSYISPAFIEKQKKIVR